MTEIPITADSPTGVAISRTGLLFAGLGLVALALPLVQFKPNRIVLGEGISLTAALGPPGWVVLLGLAVALLIGVTDRASLPIRLAIGVAGVAAAFLILGAAVRNLTPPDNNLARVSPAAGFWLLLLAFALMMADALSRMRLSLRLRWLMLAAVLAMLAAILWSGWLDGVSVMREYAARQDLFHRESLRHLILAFGSLGAAILVGLPLGILIYQVPRLKRAVLGVLNILQTIPSLAMFGLMIPLFGWVAATVPGAASIGVAGIGIFPALVALFLYSLLPVVSNTVVGLNGVSPATKEAAYGLGMTDAQVLGQVLIPLALPVLLAAVRIVLVQNIGLAVIAGLIGGGGYGTFVFQGLNQTAMDLVLLGALPTIALALTAGIALDLLVEALDHRKRRRDAP
ncbi:osmoprotectant transport system permease protein [Paracoccus isoporae]|uniref:Osmoprotectant transport system permease protein n=1 Tax=Paracoccus isoporae TaxID=591205 RepID=A0A1G6TY20_9RHOB|nr:ABC transporter permease [Paracoccus isoporae]SDD33195.1 osmoprotectant transport system permease protein [Paracoccus isoporae]